MSGGSMTKKALLYGLCVIVAFAFMLGCQPNSPGIDKETQSRITILEGKVNKLENALQEKDTVISNLKQQISTIMNQSDSLSNEFRQYKSYSESKFAVNDIDIEKLMWNTWIALGLQHEDRLCLYERYGDFNKFGIPRTSGTINRPVLCNKLANKAIVRETSPFKGTE